MEKEIKKEENRMGSMPVGKLLFKMSLPAMFSMLIQALYNIVDSIFVARYSEKALTAVSLAFPIQNLMIACAVGISIGICSVISRRLGEQNEKQAETTAQTGYSILLIFIVVFMVMGVTIVKPFFRLYTDDPELLDLCNTYLSICLLACAGCFLLTFCEKSIQGTGDTFHPMIIQMSGAIFNIIFDPIFIFGWFGLPAMGIAGAAIATVAGQFLSMFLGVKFIKDNKYLDVKWLKPSIDKKCSKDILEVGVPSAIMQGIGTIMTSLMNAILISYTILATTVFGVYFKLQSFVFMPIFGLNQGLLPILGYNYGSRNKQRMMQALKICLITAVIMMLVGTLLFNTCGNLLLGLFNASDEMLALGIPALKKISLSFPLAGICIVLGSIFQALGDGWISMVCSIIRQIVVLIPSAYFFGKIRGRVEDIWYSFLFAEFFALTLHIIFYKKEEKNKLQF